MESPHSLRPLSLGHEGRVPGGRRASPAHAGGSSQASRGQQTVPAGLKPWLRGVLLGGGGQEGLRGGGGAQAKAAELAAKCTRRWRDAHWVGRPWQRPRDGAGRRGAQRAPSACAGTATAGHPP